MSVYFGNNVRYFDQNHKKLVYLFVWHSPLHYFCVIKFIKHKNNSTKSYQPFLIAWREGEMKINGMKINFNEGISMEINGELGKYKTIPIESLVKIAQSLQELVFTVARLDLPSDTAIDLNNFKLELSRFEPGSAIPTFSPTPRYGATLDNDRQITSMSESLNLLFDISDKGAYADLMKIYPEPERRNEIVEKLYNFNSSFGNSPVSLYGGGQDRKTAPKYNIKQFKASVKQDLIARVTPVDNKQETETRLATLKVNIGEKGETRRIQEVYNTDNHSLTYTFTVICIKGTEYLLKYPLRCLIEKEDDYYIIKNEQLDLVGTGIREEEAVNNFCDEFDYLYKRLNSLQDDKLSDRLVSIKYILNLYVNGVKTNQHGIG